MIMKEKWLIYGFQMYSQNCLDIIHKELKDFVYAKFPFHVVQIKTEEEVLWRKWMPINREVYLLTLASLKIDKGMQQQYLF